MGFKKAIDSKPPVIADYKVITFSVSNPEIDEIYQSNKFIQVKKIIKLEVSFYNLISKTETVEYILWRYLKMK